MQPSPLDHRLHFKWFPNPGYLGCKTKPPFPKQKVNTIHNCPAKLLTLTDTASHQIGSGLPRDVLRESRTPPGLGIEGTLEQGEERRSGWLDHRLRVKAPLPVVCDCSRGEVKPPQKPSAAYPEGGRVDPCLAQEAVPTHPWSLQSCNLCASG